MSRLASSLRCLSDWRMPGRGRTGPGSRRAPWSRHDACRPTGPREGDRTRAGHPPGIVVGFPSAFVFVGVQLPARPQAGRCVALDLRCSQPRSPTPRRSPACAPRQVGRPVEQGPRPRRFRRNPGSRLNVSARDRCRDRAQPRSRGHAPSSCRARRVLAGAEGSRHHATGRLPDGDRSRPARTTRPRHEPVSRS